MVAIFRIKLHRRHRWLIPTINSPQLPVGNTILLKWGVGGEKAIQAETILYNGITASRLR